MPYNTCKQNQVFEKPRDQSIIPLLYNVCFGCQIPCRMQGKYLQGRFIAQHYNAWKGLLDCSVARNHTALCLPSYFTCNCVISNGYRSADCGQYSDTC